MNTVVFELLENHIALRIFIGNLGFPICLSHLTLILYSSILLTENFKLAAEMESFKHCFPLKHLSLKFGMD